MNLRDRFLNPRRNFDRIDSSFDGESRYRPWKLFISRILLRKCNMESGPRLLMQNLRKNTPRFVGINFVSNLHFVACRRVTPPYHVIAGPGVAEYIFISLIISSSRPCDTSGNGEAFALFRKSCETQISLCAIFWTLAGGARTPGSLSLRK